MIDITLLFFKSIIKCPASSSSHNAAIMHARSSFFTTSPARLTYTSLTSI